MARLQLVAKLDIPEVGAIRVFSDIEVIKKGVRQLSKSGIPRAIMRASNKSLGKTKTQVRKELMAKFNLRSKTLNPMLTKRNATMNTDPYIQGRGSQIPLSQVRGSIIQKALGVSINTGTGKRIIKHSFLATMPNGRAGVFKRTNAKGGKRVPYIDSKGKKQNKNLPIRELKFPSVAHMITQPRFATMAFKFYTRDYPIQLRRQLNFEFDRLGGARTG